VSFPLALQVLVALALGAVVIFGPFLLVMRAIAKKYNFAKWQPEQDKHVVFTEFHQNGEGFLNGMTSQNGLVPKDPQDYAKAFVPKDGAGESKE
jgi:hypothetical protein